MYRAWTGKLTAIAHDRRDVQFVVEKCARGIVLPRETDVQKVEKVVKCLQYRKEKPMRYEILTRPRRLTRMVDVDWDGEPETMKLTSSGILFGGMAILLLWMVNVWWNA